MASAPSSLPRVLALLSSLDMLYRNASYALTVMLMCICWSGTTLSLGTVVLGRTRSISSSGRYDRGSRSTAVREELLAVLSLIRAGDDLASCAGDALESCSNDLLPGLPIASAASRRGD